MSGSDTLSAMNRTRSEFLASAIVVGAVALLTLAVGVVSTALGHDLTFVTQLGLLIAAISCVGFLLAWRAPKR